MKIQLLASMAFLSFVAASPHQETTSDEAEKAKAASAEWIPLFNGKNLEGWHPKFAGHDLDENYLDTFQVVDGVLRVDYSKYESFDSKFGHLFYETPYSHYRLRVEYRFVGNQVPKGPGWAFRNNGLMLHCQPPKSMGRAQNFPVSIEVQLLGGRGEGKRTTANLCTPGTHVVMNDELVTRHCIDSSSQTYHGDQWVTVEIEVRGGDVVKHFIDGKVVLEYEKPQLDEKDGDAKKLIEKGQGKILEGGYIAIQAESHPTEFRKIEIMVLEKDD